MDFRRSGRPSSGAAVATGIWCRRPPGRATYRLALSYATGAPSGILRHAGPCNRSEWHAVQCLFIWRILAGRASWLPSVLPKICVLRQHGYAGDAPANPAHDQKLWDRVSQPNVRRAGQPIPSAFEASCFCKKFHFRLYYIQSVADRGRHVRLHPMRRVGILLGLLALASAFDFHDTKLFVLQAQVCEGLIGGNEGVGPSFLSGTLPVRNGRASPIIPTRLPNRRMSLARPLTTGGRLRTRCTMAPRCGGGVGAGAGSREAGVRCLWLILFRSASSPQLPFSSALRGRSSSAASRCGWTTSSTSSTTTRSTAITG